jgi:hypothetical protein
MTAEEVMQYLRCGRTFLYSRLRHLAIDFAPGSRSPMLRWRRRALEALARPHRPRARIRNAGGGKTQEKPAEKPASYALRADQ